MLSDKMYRVLLIWLIAFIMVSQVQALDTDAESDADNDTDADKVSQAQALDTDAESDADNDTDVDKVAQKSDGSAATSETDGCSTAVTANNKIQPLTAEMEMALIALLSRKGPTDPSFRENLLGVARRKKNRHILHMELIEDPISKDNRQRIITNNGLIVPRVDELDAIVMKYATKYLRPNRLVLHRRIARRYCGFSHKYIQDTLNTIPPAQPIFDNAVPLVPVTSREPMSRLQIDLVMLGTKTKPVYVLSMLDVFSRHVWWRVVPQKTSEAVAKELANFFYDFGTPSLIQCDNGGEFKGKVQLFCSKLGIKIIRSRPDHPQSQGKVERVHQTLRNRVRQAGTISNWKLFLKRAQLDYNESFHRAIGTTPYEAFFARSPNRLCNEMLYKLSDESEDLNSGTDQRKEKKAQSTSSENGNECADENGKEQTATFLKKANSIRRRATSLSHNAARRMINTKLAKQGKGKSVYDIGQNVWLKTPSSDRRLKRGSTTAKFVRAEIIDAKGDKYKVKYIKPTGSAVEIWVSVSHLAANTRQKEHASRQCQDKTSNAQVDDEDQAEEYGLNSNATVQAEAYGLNSNATAQAEDDGLNSNATAQAEDDGLNSNATAQAEDGLNSNATAEAEEDGPAEETVKETPQTYNLRHNPTKKRYSSSWETISITNVDHCSGDALKRMKASQQLDYLQRLRKRENDRQLLKHNFMARILHNNLQPVDNAGDGNCMFDAISHQLNIHPTMSQHDPHELRQLAVNFLVENPKTPDGTPLMNFISGGRSTRRWTSYLDSMRRPGTWGDHLVLQALANALDTNIIIMSSIRQEIETIMPYNGESAYDITLGHIHELHYISLQGIPGDGDEGARDRVNGQGAEDGEGAEDGAKEGSGQGGSDANAHGDVSSKSNTATTSTEITSSVAIGSIPGELLQMILGYCLSGENGTDPDWLGGVCRTWKRHLQSAYLASKNRRLILQTHAKDITASVLGGVASSGKCTCNKSIATDESSDDTLRCLIQDELDRTTTPVMPFPSDTNAALNTLVHVDEITELFAHLRHLLWNCLTKDRTGCFYLMNDTDFNSFCNFTTINRQIRLNRGAHWLFMNPLVSAFILRKQINVIGRKVLKMIAFTRQEYKAFKKWKEDLLRKL